MGDDMVQMYPPNAWLTMSEAAARWGAKPLGGKRAQYVRADRLAAAQTRISALEAALESIINLGGAYGWAEYGVQADAIARAALKGAAK